MRQLAALVVAFALLAGCTGNIIGPPTPNPTGNALAIGCPTLSDPTPKCPGVALTGLSLSCSSPITVTFDTQHQNRVGITLANQSKIAGTVRLTQLAAINEPCHGIGANSAINVTLGFQYVGDYSTTLPICILRSKLTFTQFDVGGGIFNGAWDGTMKGMLHDTALLQMDTQLVASLTTPTPGTAPPPPRCGSWTELP